MTRQKTEHHPDRLRIDGVRLRRHLVAVAAAIACTEEQIAETLERMALVLPQDAARLRASAAQARRYATLERGRVARLGFPAPRPR